MIENPDCPACGCDVWRAISRERFEKEPAPEDAYRALRYRVLFEQWIPGKSTFEATTAHCRDCGFVTYLPRPSAQDVSLKYQYLAQHSPREESKREVTELDLRRSRDVYEFISPAFLSARREKNLEAEHHSSGGRSDEGNPSVLDFGGGNGALLASFLEHGYQAHVVDFVTETVPGVERLGATLDDISEERSFDLIVACHVLEHLAEPVTVLGELKERLTDGGMLFVEVPLEVLGGPPRLREPVTHINFFCEGSLRVALERAGLQVHACKTMACTFESGAVRYAVRALATRSQSGVKVQLPGDKEVRRLLGAGPVTRFLWALLSKDLRSKAPRSKAPRSKELLRGAW